MPCQTQLLCPALPDPGPYLGLHLPGLHTGAARWSGLAIQVQLEEVRGIRSEFESGTVGEPLLGTPECLGFSPSCVPDSFRPVYILAAGGAAQVLRLLPSAWGAGGVPA